MGCKKAMCINYCTLSIHMVPELGLQLFLTLRQLNIATTYCINTSVCDTLRNENSCPFGD